MSERVSRHDLSIAHTRSLGTGRHAVNTGGFVNQFSTAQVAEASRLLIAPHTPRLTKLQRLVRREIVFRKACAVFGYEAAAELFPIHARRRPTVGTLVTLETDEMEGTTDDTI